MTYSDHYTWHLTVIVRDSEGNTVALSQNSTSQIPAQPTDSDRAELEQIEREAWRQVLGVATRRAIRDAEKDRSLKP